jgi:D-alanine-D-alanine ligase
MTVGVLFGGPSPEHDISILTGLQAARQLAVDGNQVHAIYWSKAGSWHLVPPAAEARDFLSGVPSGSRPLRLELGGEPGFIMAGSLGRTRALALDAVVVACHGGPGEDGSLQAVLDLAGIRYTGPSAAGAALGMDKLAFGGVVSASGLPTLPRVVIGEGFRPGFPGPYIVKPRFGGSSIGISVAEDAATAVDLAHTQPALADGAIAEPFVADAVDLSIAVRTHPGVQLSPIERPGRAPSGESIYSYRDKYLLGGGLEGASREIPATLPAGIEATLRTAAEAVVRLALVRSLARIDFLWSGDQVWVNEINTVPGALARYLWAPAGVSFSTLLADMLAEARQGASRSFSTEGADGTALRGASAIAEKLS